MPKVTFDRYFDYAELTGILEAQAAAHPDLVDLRSIGKSYEGRDLWLAAVTNKKTGPAEDKPAMLVDGNIHSSEVTASAVALNHLVTLLEGYGHDEAITRCLDSRAFYILPRVNPDGAELALAEQPKFTRSSTRPYPYNEDPVSGLIVEDVDGNGHILTMRIKDSNGRWKKNAKDPRIMEPRDPVETGGEYYRVFPEGRLENYDGVTIQPADAKEGLDLNRNWPSEWRREHEQPGAGPFPLSEPETHALAKFVSEHPNIFTWIAGHTFSGVLLRAGFVEPDDKLPHHDLEHYKMVGAKGTELTDYPAISVYHDFRIRKEEQVFGSVDWGYRNFGIFVWAPEYWAPHRTAGVEIDNYAKWFFHHPVEDDLKMIEWSDKALDGKGFVDWYAFDHPQLGEVELGGWDLLKGIFNPPEHLLAEQIRPFPEWFTWQLLMSPRLELKQTTVTPLGHDHWLVRAVVENTGYLPTYCSEMALTNKAVRPVVAEIELGEGAKLIHGEPRAEFGQLGGRAYKPSMAIVFLADGTDDRLKVEWTIAAPEGTQVDITMRHEKAGVVRQAVVLGG